jgi:hypothetical protein
VSIRGERAQALAQYVLNLVESRVPHDVELVIRTFNKTCVIEATGPASPNRILGPGQPGYEKFVKKGLVRNGESIQLVTEASGAGSIAGRFGPWVPFLGRSLRARLTATDVLETVQQVISDASREAWPRASSEVTSELDGQSIRLFFDRGTDFQWDVGRVPISMCLGIAEDKQF